MEEYIKYSAPQIRKEKNIIFFNKIQNNPFIFSQNAVKYNRYAEDIKR